MEIFQMLAELKAETEFGYFDNLVVEIRGKTITISYPMCRVAGADSAYLPFNGTSSFEELKSFIDTNSGEYAAASSAIRCEFVKLSDINIDEIAGMVKRFGYPYFKPLYQNESKQLYWAGFDIESPRILNRAEYDKQRNLNLYERFVHDFFYAPQVIDFKTANLCRTGIKDLKKECTAARPPGCSF